MKVLATRRFPGPAWDELDDVEYLSGPLPDALGVPRPGVEVLVVVGETVDERTLELLPDLKLVANYGVGYDGIDVDACDGRGVAVTNTPGALGTPTADLTLGLILAVRRRIVEGDRFVRSGRWSESWASGQLMGQDLVGATLGIVGLGRIGREVARRAAPFGMQLLYTQRTQLSADEERLLPLRYRVLDELLAGADIVTLHVPLTDETRGLIDARRLALMRDGACLINTARGAIVDEDALARELVSGRLRAGLDVFVDEPRVRRELRELPNVVLTPHIGSATPSAREGATRELVDNILAAAEGRPVPNRVYPSGKAP